MTRLSLITAITLFSFLHISPAIGQNLSGVEPALWPLPVHLRADATVYAITDDGLLKPLRQGTNGFFCIADDPGDDRFSVACHANSLQPVLERQAVLSKNGKNSATRDSILVSEIESGKLEIVPGAISRFISGTLNAATQHPDNVRMWSEIHVPFAEPGTTGLPIDSAGEDPWLMSEGRPGAHVMIRYRSASWQEMLAEVGAHIME